LGAKGLLEALERQKLGSETLGSEWLTAPRRALALYSRKNLFSIETGGKPRATVSGPFGSVQRPGRDRVGELDDSGDDPTPGISAIVISGGCELVDATVALLDRFVAVALQHQGGRTPDIDLGYHIGGVTRSESLIG
jgi:hypothetical protein